MFYSYKNWKFPFCSVFIEVSECRHFYLQLHGVVWNVSSCCSLQRLSSGERIQSYSMMRIFKTSTCLSVLWLLVSIRTSWCFFRTPDVLYIHRWALSPICVISNIRLSLISESPISDWESRVRHIIGYRNKVLSHMGYPTSFSTMKKYHSEGYSTPLPYHGARVRDSLC